ncbi:MAG: hypothetical protein ACJAUC_004976 [Planctomycetota bacterium]|jgi:hypothetical protein
MDMDLGLKTVVLAGSRRFCATRAARRPGQLGK